MRKTIIFLLIISLFLSLCSCKSSIPTEQAATLGPQETILASDEQQKSEPDVSNDSTIPPQNETLYHEGQAIDNLPIRTNNLNSFLPPSTTYSELIKSVGDDGLIVVGYAEGLREGHSPEGYTLTDFVVQSVYYGEIDPDQKIRICESFILKNSTNEAYIYQNGNGNTYLKDNQLVLLFLAKENSIENTYYPVFYEIFLPSDYNNFTDTYLTELFDYFRGNREMYQYPEMILVEKNEGSEEAPNQVYIAYGGSYWPKQSISDTELIAQMNDHILMQTVMKYKIKIWPSGHKQYYANNLPEETQGMRFISYPQE